MSLDHDASDRTFDRQMAYLGLLDDAAPIFRDGHKFPVSVCYWLCPIWYTVELLGSLASSTVKSVRPSTACAPRC